MKDAPRSRACSRRKLLGGGAAFVAGGLVGGAAGCLVPAASKEPDADPLALPWPWAPLDPLEAGVRSYRAYLDAGG